jgi:hypothetical protein
MIFLAAVLLVTISPSHALRAVGSTPLSIPQADDSNVRPPVTTDDIKIVERAKSILSSTAVWNRQDNRKCPAGATTYSLYCALEKASGEISGHFAHREAAMQEVRFVVDDIARNRNYEHRLMDYNNDPTTTLADIQNVLDRAEANIKKRLAEQNQAPQPKP